MLSKIVDIKNTFVALMPRSNGMPLGRTALQDFEIAYFLNVAYNKLLTERIAMINQAYHGYASGEGSTVPRTDAAMGGMLADMGMLYRPIVPLDPWDGDLYLKSDEFLLWGENSLMFKLYLWNGYMPYILSANIYETEKQLSTKQKQKRKAFPIRILTGPETIENSLLLRKENTDRLPYRVGRIVARYYRSAGNFLSDTLEQGMDIFNTYMGARGDNYSQLVSRIQGGYRISYLLEVVHKPTEKDARIRCNMEFIAQPEPITDVEISSDSQRIIEVGFGYEIAELAAQMATAVLNGAPQKQ